MIDFRYRARAKNGHWVEGTIAAENTIAVVDHLLTRDLTAVHVGRDQVKALRWIRDTPIMGRSVSCMTMYRSLGMLLTAGITLRRALSIVSEEMTDTAFQEALQSMISAVDAGRSLAAAMEMHSSLFTPLAIALVHAAEQSGTLNQALDNYAATLERQRSLSRRITAAMAYPAIVLIAACALLGVIIINILPVLGSLFIQMNVEMPPIMRLSLTISRWGAHYGWVLGPNIVAGIVVCVAGAARTLQRVEGDRFRLLLPIFGRLQQRAIIARWARLLASLLQAGIGIVAALEITLPALGSPVYTAEIQQISRRLEDGGAIADALRQSPWFDSLSVHLIAIGEETGQLDTNMLRLAEMYERDLNEELATIVAVIEPLILCVVGSIVGAVVLSIFVPLYSLIGNVR